MRIVCVGGGPGGLYFAILMKKANPAHDIRVIERNRPDDTFGFGVVFSDATMAGIAKADSEAYGAIAQQLVHWDDIEVRYCGNAITSTGHGFSGMSRQSLLRTLQMQARDAGVQLEYEREVASLDALRGADLIVASDGANSAVRRLLEPQVTTTVDLRPNRFVWLGTTRPFSAFTFYFRQTQHGLWRVHAYQYEPSRSTFIVECREETWHAAGMDRATEEETAAFLEAVFSEELEGHKLITNRSLWRQFPTVRTEPWFSRNVVLLGDAAHTAHFSLGSGTRMAMEDAVALRDALTQPDLAAALAAYEAARRPQVESLQRSAEASLQWFEHTERYMKLDPVQLTFSLLTRSLRMTHEDLRARDQAFVSRVNQYVADKAGAQSGVSPYDSSAPPPPMFTPFRLRDLVIPNRVVVSPMCQYAAEDGTVGDWHLVNLGSRAIGGAGLVMAETTAVSAGGRISIWCTGLYKDEHAQAWKRIVDFVHRESAAKIGVQLGHAGRNGVSITRADMDQAVGEYARAAKLALAAGFDLLELDMANGCLLAAFLSPLTNSRTDSYGGLIENRLRFPLEAFDACRHVWPAHQPMSVRISVVDWASGGMSADEAVEMSHVLKAHGCDIVDVSAGQTVHHEQPTYEGQSQTAFADRIRHDVGIATMVAGNISSNMDVNTIIAAGRADLCVLASEYLFDPYSMRRAASMLGYELPWPAPYQPVQRYSPRFEFKFTGDKS